MDKNGFDRRRKYMNKSGPKSGVKQSWKWTRLDSKGFVWIRGHMAMMSLHFWVGGLGPTFVKDWFWWWLQWWLGIRFIDPGFIFHTPCSPLLHLVMTLHPSLASSTYPVIQSQMSLFILYEGQASTRCFTQLHTHPKWHYILQVTSHVYNSVAGQQVLFYPNSRSGANSRFRQHLTNF
jgi:hypothetical protein